MHTLQLVYRKWKSNYHNYVLSQKNLTTIFLEIISVSVKPKNVLWTRSKVDSRPPPPMHYYTFKEVIGVFYNYDIRTKFIFFADVILNEKSECTKSPQAFKSSKITINISLFYIWIEGISRSTKIVFESFGSFLSRSRSQRSEALLIG